jgi:hypothetical protein
MGWALKSYKVTKLTTFRTEYRIKKTKYSCLDLKDFFEGHWKGGGL